MVLYGFETYGIIKKVHITKKQGSHTIANVEIYVDDDKKLLMLNKHIGQITRLEDEKQIYLVGRITNISGSVSYNNNLINIEIISNSLQIDKEPKFRVYQSPDKTFNQVIDKISTNNFIIQILENEIKNKKISNVLLQNNETDFQFLKKVAELAECKLFICDTNKNKALINIGKCINKTPKIINLESIKQINFSMNEEKITVDFLIKEYFDIGQTVTIEGYDYIIDEVQIIEENKEISFYYVASEETFNKYSNNDMEIASIGLGKIVNNEDPDCLGRIQVELQDVEDCNTGERMWIQYIPNMTEKDNGMIFVPDINEMVNVIFQGGSLFAFGCVRKTKISNFDVNKKILNIKGKRLIFSEDSLKLISDKNEVLISNDTTSFKNNKCEVVIKDDVTTIKSGDTKINIGDKEIQLLSKDKIDVSGNKVIIKTKSLDVG